MAQVPPVRERGVEKNKCETAIADIMNLWSCLHNWQIPVGKPHMT
jgi:hypothetical protein